MKTHTPKLLIAGLAATALALGLSLSAQAGQGICGQGGPGGGGGPAAKGPGAKMERLMAYDGNGDGQITVDEIREGRASMFGEADADKNGTLNRQEFEALAAAKARQRAVQRFDQLDQDGDGEVSKAETDARMDFMLARMDRNGDGVITPDEMTRRGKGGWRK
ncbi:MAG: EF-hand domain-containing protein [Magnetovibrionaceae bacterium]